MNIPAGIPILNANKGKEPEDLLEGITARKLSENVLEIPLAMDKDGKPLVASVPYLHLAVQFRFTVHVPLAVHTPEEAQELVNMVMQRGLQPEWDKANASLVTLQARLHKAAENTVKMEHQARLAEGGKK